MQATMETRRHRLALAVRAMAHVRKAPIALWGLRLLFCARSGPMGYL